MAIGIGRMFGFEFKRNFNLPYAAKNIKTFWQKWHISLSSWFRDYLYIPLGGSKNGKFKAIRNTFIIFLVSGFWHGASWNFIAWGFIHACGFLPLLLLNRNRKHVTDVVAQERKLPNLKELWQMTSTFAFVTFAWVFFRAKDMGEALGYIERICSSIYNSPKQFLALPGGKIAFILIIPLIFGDWWLRRNERSLDSNRNKLIREILYALLVILIYNQIMYQKTTQFVYFEF
jgi:D-alanyl-lipoteichoic acid acyltransferase DltB (MBOAT superfamily)